MSNYVEIPAEERERCEYCNLPLCTREECTKLVCGMVPRAEWKVCCGAYLTSGGPPFCTGPKVDWRKRALEAEKGIHAATFEVEAVLAMLGGDAVRVRESNGSENVFASLAVSVAKLMRSAYPR